jgi:hypothetical protein
MVEIEQDAQSHVDDRMRFLVAHVGDEADAAGIVLLGGIVESLRRRKSGIAAERLRSGFSDMLGGFRHLGVSSTGPRASSCAAPSRSSNHKTVAGVTEIVTARNPARRRKGGSATAIANLRAHVSPLLRKASDAPPLQALSFLIGAGVLSSADPLDETMASKSEPRFKVSIADIFAGLTYCQIWAEVTSNRMSFGRLRGPMLAAMLSDHLRGREGLNKEESMRSLDWKLGLPFALALAASVAVPQHAFAQFFFRPFANAFRTQIPSEGPPAFASRPAVASILGRTGFQLVGPLGRRGDQIVATGVSRREGGMRFIIDPYAGRILRAVRLGAPLRRGAPDAPPMTGGPGPAGPGPAARGLDNARHPETARAPQAPGDATLDAAPNQQTQPRASAAKRSASSKNSRAIVPPPAAPAATQKASEPVASPAAQADKTSSQSPPPATTAQDAPADAKTPSPSPAPAETSANSGVDAPAANPAKQAADKPASGSIESQAKSAGSAEASGAAPTVAAQESKQQAESAAAPPAPAPAPAEKAADTGAEKAADTGAQAQSAAAPAASVERSAPAKRAAAARAAAQSRRAIVPPHASSGTTVVTPAAPLPPPAAGASGSATAPDDAGKPNAGG